MLVFALFEKLESNKVLQKLGKLLYIWIFSSASISINASFATCSRESEYVCILFAKLISLYRSYTCNDNLSLLIKNKMYDF